jgi:hypothetical protein
LGDEALDRSGGAAFQRRATRRAREGQHTDAYAGSAGYLTSEATDKP